MNPKKISKAPEPQVREVSPQPSLEERQQSLKLSIDSARQRRFTLQGKRYKDHNDNLKLLALDVQIGQLLLQLEDLK